MLQSSSHGSRQVNSGAKIMLHDMLLDSLFCTADTPSFFGLSPTIWHGWLKASGWPPQKEVQGYLYKQLYRGATCIIQLMKGSKDVLSGPRHLPQVAWHFCYWMIQDIVNIELLADWHICSASILVGNAPRFWEVPQADLGVTKFIVACNAVFARFACDIVDMHVWTYFDCHNHIRLSKSLPPSPASPPTFHRVLIMFLFIPIYPF